MNANSFSTALAGFRFRWRLGLLVAGVVLALALGVITLVLLGVLDFYSGFTDPAREASFGAIVVAAFVGIVGSLWSISRYAKADAAAAADRALVSPRREVLSALELE